MASRREQLLAALFEALGKVEGVELIERNRTHQIDQSVNSALVLMDGNVEGETDPKDWDREPVFRLELTPEVMGCVRAPDAEAGTLRDELLSRAVAAVWTDRDLRRLVADYDGYVAIDGIDSMLAVKAASKASAVFVIGLRIGFVFDPANP